jgi:hypothetical protein
VKTLLNPRADTATNDAYTGPASQLTVDTSRWELRLHDGVTPGGHRILNLQQLLLLFMSKDSEFGEVAFAEGELGYLVRIGDRQYELREITADVNGGVIVTNGLATAANTSIKIDTAWLSKQVSDLRASGIRYLVTAGTNIALTLSIPVANPDYDPEDEESEEPETVTDIPWPAEAVNGTLLGVKFHINVLNTATLSINGQAGKPILLAGNVSNIEKTALIGVHALLMKVDTSWIVIGAYRADLIPIVEIPGLNFTEATTDPVVAAVPAKNVQEALTALKRLVDGDDDDDNNLAGGASLRYIFGAPSAYVGTLDARVAALTNGQAFLAMWSQSTGNGSPENPLVYATHAYMLFKYHGKAYAAEVAKVGSQDNYADVYGATTLYGIPLIAIEYGIGTGPVGDRVRAQHKGFITPTVNPLSLV